MNAAGESGTTGVQLPGVWVSMVTNKSLPGSLSAFKREQMTNVDSVCACVRFLCLSIIWDLSLFLSRRRSAQTVNLFNFRDLMMRLAFAVEDAGRIDRIDACVCSLTLVS